VDPKDTARRLLRARQRLLERASCSCEKPLLSARGTPQDVYGMNQLKDDWSRPVPWFREKKMVTQIKRIDKNDDFYKMFQQQVITNHTRSVLIIRLIRIDSYLRS